MKKNQAFSKDFSVCESIQTIRAFVLLSKEFGGELFHIVNYLHPLHEALGASEADLHKVTSGRKSRDSVGVTSDPSATVRQYHANVLQRCCKK